MARFTTENEYLQAVDTYKLMKGIKWLKTVFAIMEYEQRNWHKAKMPVIPLDEAKEIVKKEFS